MTKKQFKQSVFAIAMASILLVALGFLSIREGVQERNDQIQTYEKTLEAERESFAVKEETLAREITRYKDKNSDLERTNDILTEYIQMKQQELEDLR